MARIAGVDIPNDKQVAISLTYIYGIGRTQAQKILAQTKVDPDRACARPDGRRDQPHP